MFIAKFFDFKLSSRYISLEFIENDIKNVFPLVVFPLEYYSSLIMAPIFQIAKWALASVPLIYLFRISFNNSYSLWTLWNIPLKLSTQLEVQWESFIFWFSGFLCLYKFANVEDLFLQISLNHGFRKHILYKVKPYITGYLSKPDTFCAISRCLSICHLTIAFL